MSKPRDQINNIDTKIVGIYKIVNLVNSEIYIGSSIKCIKNRWKLHIRDLFSNNHHSNKLQNAWNKYGEESFSFEIIELIDMENCIKTEQHYLDTMKPFYNVCPIAGNCRGRKFSEETKKKMSEIGKKRGINDFLKRQQISPYPNDTETSRYCNRCNSFKDINTFRKNKKIRVRECRECYSIRLKNRPSRAVPGAREAYNRSKGHPIIAKKENEILEFFALRDAERYFKKIYPKFNKVFLKNKALKNEEYYGYIWSFV